MYTEGQVYKYTVYLLISLNKKQTQKKQANKTLPGKRPTLIIFMRHYANPSEISVCPMNRQNFQERK